MTNPDSNSGTRNGNRVVRRADKQHAEDAVKGQPAAIYCRISRAQDEDQTGVDRQEQICRGIARRIGLKIVKRHVYVDNNRSAWQRNRKRPKWDALLEAMAAGEVRHVIVYHPDRLMRQPHDLEELLQVARDHRVILHGQANRRDLSSADDVYILRLEVAHACRESDDKSRRIKDKFEQKAEAGTPHGGVRVFGYARDRTTIIEDEAETVRAIFDDYLDGASPLTIAKSLNQQSRPALAGKPWDAAKVLRVIDSRHIAGIYVFRGEEIGEGSWPAIIDRGTWDEARERRQYRSAQVIASRKNQGRFFLLRGLVVCAKCGTRMSGNRRYASRSGDGYRGRMPTYVCHRVARLDDLKCSRSIDAEPLEDFVQDAAIKILEELEISDPISSTTVPEAEREQIAADEAQLRELNTMWTNKDVTTTEYLSMKKAIEARIKKAQRKTIVRPTGMIADLIGPDAEAKWHRQTDERKNASLRFLFNAVLIGEATTPVGEFDFDRIICDPNPMD